MPEVNPPSSAGPVVVEVLLGGRLLARYEGDRAIEALSAIEGDRAMIALAKSNLLQERLVDEPHLADLEFEVRRS